MTEGEFAVHYSSFVAAEGRVPFCTVFGSLEVAKEFARERVEARPELRCRIYDHRGDVGAPVAEIRGRDFKDSEISARFRRWVGSVLFFGGLILMLVDWAKDFTLLWPSTIGVRMWMAGLILLVTEAAFVLIARLGRRRAGDKKTA